MSQEYTPVEWVDETLATPGTIINAERLTAMQQAHHYADGYREVDSVPTEDPGADYKVVVYCTFDNQRYRWNGTAWQVMHDPTLTAAVAALEASKQAALSETQLTAVNSGITADLVSKLGGIEAGAQVNVQADWTEADTTADSYIKDKPTLATVATSGAYADLSNIPLEATNVEITES